MGNSCGAMHKCTDLTDTEPKHQGGFIWDYIDQSIYKKDRYGEEFQAYGGDFGERPTDYNFSGNGTVYGGNTRCVSPKMQEVKFNYQNSTAEVTAESRNGQKIKTCLSTPTALRASRPLQKTERRMRRQTHRRLWSRSRNRPIHCRFSRLVFNNSKYATRNVMGSEKIINNFTPEELRAYYNDFYRPDLQAVIVVGDIDAAKIETEIQTVLSNPIPDERTPNPDWYTRSRTIANRSTRRSIRQGNDGEPSITLLKRVRQTPPASLKEMMKENLINLLLQPNGEKYLQK